MCLFSLAPEESYGFFLTGLVCARMLHGTVDLAEALWRKAANPAVFAVETGSQWLTGTLPVSLCDSTGPSVKEVSGIRAPSPAKKPRLVAVPPRAPPLVLVSDSPEPVVQLKVCSLCRFWASVLRSRVFSFWWSGLTSV